MNNVELGHVLFLKQVLRCNAPCLNGVPVFRGWGWKNLKR